MSREFFYKTNGAPSIPMKQYMNNAISKVYMGMPQKFYPSDNGTEFSNARIAAQNNAGNVNSNYKTGKFASSSGEFIRSRKISAVGKTAGTIDSNGNRINKDFSFRSQDTTSRNSALTRVRGGGTVAPKKKGAY